MLVKKKYAFIYILFFFFLFKSKREDIVHGKVLIDNQEVKRIGLGEKHLTYKYLGVLIGEDLTFSEQVGRVKGRLISAAFILNQSKNVLPFKSRLDVYRCTGPSLKVI